MNTLTGLSEAEVAIRLQQHGYNEHPFTKSLSILATTWSVIREPMFLLRLACGTIYLFLGVVKEAVMLLNRVSMVPIERARGNVAGAQYAKCSVRTIRIRCRCSTIQLRSHKEP